MAELTATTVHDRPALPIAAAVVAVSAWGLGPILVRAVGVSGLSVGFWRMLIAIPVMFTIARVVEGGRPDVRLALRCAWCGVLFGLQIVFGFTSFKLTSVVNASIIPALQPLLVLLVAGRMFGERPTRRDVGAAAAALVGVAIVVIGSGATGTSSVRGDVFAVLNLMAWTAYFIEVKRVRSLGIGPFTLMAHVVLTGAVVTTPVALLAADDLGEVHGWGWLWILGLVCVPGALGHGLMAWAHRYVDINLASLLTLATPVVSTLLAWAIYDEHLTVAQAAGAAIVLGALAVIVQGRRRPIVEVEPL